MEASEVVIGYLSEDFEPQDLDARSFPSKVGGRPVWLDGRDVPSEVVCESCGKCMSFLLQLYAPAPPVQELLTLQQSIDERRACHLSNGKGEFEREAGRVTGEPDIAENRGRSNPTEERLNLEDDIVNEDLTHGGDKVETEILNQILEQNVTHAFHRTLYVFVCVYCKGCNFTLLSSTLSRENSFYSSQAWDRQGDDTNPRSAEIHKSNTRTQKPQMPTLCPHCGLNASKGGHKCPSDVFDEYILDVEEETTREEYLARVDFSREKKKEEDYLCRAAENEDEVLDVSEQKVFEEYCNDPSDVSDEDELLETLAKHPTGSGPHSTSTTAHGGNDSALSTPSDSSPSSVHENFTNDNNTENNTNTSGTNPGLSKKGVIDNLDNEVFEYFKKRCQWSGPHVVRYAIGGLPLWYREKGRLPKNAPNCEHCGAEKMFEFQIQPSLAQVIHKDVTFALVASYCCSKFCDPKSSSGYKGSHYVSEFVHVQKEIL